MTRTALLTLVFTVLLPAAGAAQVKTIYGGDSRLDFFEVTSRAELSAMASAVSLFRETALIRDGDGYKVKGSIFGSEARRICPGERFFEQRGGAYCSGTLIAPDLVLTAGHCMGPKDKPADRCGLARFVFGFSVNSEGALPERIPSSGVYSCSRVEIYVHDKGGDYSVVRLDRPVTGHAPARPYTAGPPQAGQGVFTVGGPYGLPLKVVDDAIVRKLSSNKKFFYTNLDTSGGNSGGGVFGALSGRLIGVHTASYDPDLVEIPLPPGHGLPAEDARVKEGKCKTITSLPQAGGYGKKAYSLSAITGLTGLLSGTRSAEIMVDMPPVTDVPSRNVDLSSFGAF